MTSSAKIPSSGTSPIGIVLLSAFLLAAPLLADDRIPSIVKQVQPSIVTIVGFDPDGEVASIGTAFYVEDGVLLTNRHVLEGSSSAEIRWNGTSSRPVSAVIGQRADLDLLLLRIGEGEKFPNLKLSTTEPEAGERIIVIGSPFGLEQTVSDGIVSTIRTTEEIGDVIQITAPISPGSSGSPVLNMSGEVIGIATVTYAGGQNLNFAIPVEHVQRIPRHEDLDFVSWAANVHYEYGTRAFQEGNWVEAATAFIFAIRTKPDFVDGFISLGNALRWLDKDEDAFKAFNEAIRLEPANADAHLQIGHAHIARHDWNEARESFEEALRHRADDAEALHGRAVASLKLGDRASALADYARLKALDHELADQLFAELYETEDRTAVAGRRVP